MHSGYCSSHFRLLRYGDDPFPRKTPEYIRCDKCRQYKHCDEFHKSSRAITLRQSRCIECSKDAGNTEDAKARRRVISRRYYQKHPEKCIEYSRNWQRNNPERHKINTQNGQRRYKARKRNAPTISFTAEQLAERIAYYAARCWICRVASYEQLDHVKPLTKGGSHMLSNLRPACSACNNRKNDRWPFKPEDILYAAVG